MFDLSSFDCIQILANSYKRGVTRPKTPKKHNVAKSKMCHFAISDDCTNALMQKGV